MQRSKTPLSEVAGAFIAACRRAGTRFSITVRRDPKVQRAIAGIDERAWVPIRYPNAIYDQPSQSWISDAEIAAVGYTAFASKTSQRVDGRLIVRRGVSKVESLIVV